MNEHLRNQHNFFGRSVDEIIESGFFSSFDSNILEDRDGYCIEVAVPGLTKKDLEISIEDRVLKIKGKRETSGKRRIRSKRMVEFSSTVFQRSYVLPQDVGSNGISAECKHGLLKVNLPKQQQTNTANAVTIVDAVDGSDGDGKWLSRLGRKVKTMIHRIRQKFG